MSACVDCGCDVGEGESVASDFPMCGGCGDWYAEEMANIERAEREARRADRRLVQFKAAVAAVRGFGVLL